jgi:hypothetical protein
MSNANRPYDPTNPYSSQQFGNGPNNTFPNDDSQKSSKSGCLWGCLIGGVVGFLVVVLACGIGAWYVSVNAKPWGATLARNMAVQVVEASELTAEDKTQVVGQIDRVVNAYKKGEINEEDLQRILKEVERSPLLPMAVVFGVEVQYLERSGLSAEEKEDARLQLQRIVRGGFEKKIDKAKLDALMEPLLETEPNGNKKFKDQLSDEELRKFFADAKQLADEAMIPNEAFKVDIGDEVMRIVDRALSEKKK